MASDHFASLIDTHRGSAAPGHLSAVPLLEEQVAAVSGRGRTRSSYFGRLLVASDLGAGLTAATVAGLASGLEGGQLGIFVAVAALAWVFAVFSVGLYTVDTLGVWASGLPQLGRLSGVALGLSWPLFGAAALLDGERPVITALAAVGATLGLAICGRTVAREVVHRSEPLRQRTVILGSGLVAGQLADRLRRHQEFGLEVIGVVDDDVHSAGELALPVLGRLDELDKILESHAVDRVVIAFSRASHEQLLASMRACREQRVAVDVVPRLFEFLEGARAIEQIGGLPVLSIGAHRLSRSSAAMKRVLDIVLSLVALVAVLPVLTAIALIIKLDSRGSVFFTQPRAGRDGRVFRLIKFRSMYEGADAEKIELAMLNERDDGIMFKIRRDPRVTRVGRVLRRLSLDELPQLINVLKGEMSIVGPRPLVLAESEALGSSWHARRLDLRPGLTGPWQVSGRSDLSVHDMVRLDFQYVTGWSLARDVEIILATVPVVFKGRGAY
jgi:exopolysaccharide biosynthesis polyprenyl glycosylphosphotransferase